MTRKIKLALLAAGLGLLLVAAIPALAAGIAQRAPAAEARVAIVHLAPFATGRGTAVTVTVDSAKVLTDVVYGQSTGYISVTAGSHLVEIFPGASVTPAITSTVVLTGGLDFTVIAVGNGTYQPLALKVLEDNNTLPITGTAKIRIGHLAPFSDTIAGTLIDIRLQNGTPVATDVPYGAVSTYAPVPAGRYDFKITRPGGSPTLIDPLAVELGSRQILSLFATGDGIHEPLGVFELPAGVPGHFLPLVRERLYLPVLHKDSKA